MPPKVSPSDPSWRSSVRGLNSKLAGNLAYSRFSVRQERSNGVLHGDPTRAAADFSMPWRSSSQDLINKLLRYGSAPTTGIFLTVPGNATSSVAAPKVDIAAQEFFKLVNTAIAAMNESDATLAAGGD